MSCRYVIFHSGMMIPNDFHVFFRGGKESSSGYRWCPCSPHHFGAPMGDHLSSSRVRHKRVPGGTFQRTGPGLFGWIGTLESWEDDVFLFKILISIYFHTWLQIPPKWPLGHGDAKRDGQRTFKKTRHLWIIPSLSQIHKSCLTTHLLISSMCFALILAAACLSPP